MWLTGTVAQGVSVRIGVCLGVYLCHKEWFVEKYDDDEVASGPLGEYPLPKNKPGRTRSRLGLGRRRNAEWSKRLSS